jgi:hypothetical protein
MGLQPFLFQKSRLTSGRLERLPASRYKSSFMPEWRNGRRAGFKIQCPQGREGSTPSSGTEFSSGREVLDVPIAPALSQHCATKGSNLEAMHATEN